MEVKPASKSFYRKRTQASCRTEEGDGNGKFEEVMTGVRKYVMEAIVSLDETLADIERSGGTISREKSEFLKDGIKMVAFMCRSKGRTLEEAKIRKVVNCKPCTSVTEVKGFLDLCIYYRIWIKNFAVRADPLYQLTHGKNQTFEWGSKQQEAMDDLK